MTTPKPFDEPTGLHIKSVGLYVSSYFYWNKGGVQATLFPASIFNAEPSSPLSSFTDDTVLGVSDSNYPNASLEVLWAPHYKYTYDPEGFGISFQGHMSALALVDNFSGALHRPDGVGVSYKSANYWVDYSSAVEDSMVVDGMLITLVGEDAGRMWCTYLDLLNPDDWGEAFEVTWDKNRTDPSLIIKDTFTNLSVTSGVFIPDETGAINDLSVNPRSVVPLNGRIDPDGLTVSVYCLATSSRGINEHYFGVVDLTVALKIYYKTVTDVDGNETITRHVGILAEVDPAQSPTEFNNYGLIKPLVALNYTDDYDYPARKVAQAEAFAGICFNWFASETLTMRSTLTSNIPCAGRVLQMVKRKRQVLAYNTDDPPVLVVVSTGWVAETGAAPLDGESWDDPTIFENTLSLAAVSKAEFTGTASLKYEMIGSRKITYTFVGGVRQFITMKAVAGKQSVTYTCSVALQRPRVHTAGPSNITWGEYAPFGTSADYRSTEDYTVLKQAFGTFLTGLPNETWDVAATSENMITGMYYDDGSFLEGVDGQNCVIGGGFTYKYLGEGFSFAELFDGVTTYSSNVALSAASFKMVGADQRMSKWPLLANNANAYVRFDDKVSAATMRKPGTYYGGTAIPTTDVVIPEDGSWGTDEVPGGYVYKGHTTLTRSATHEIALSYDHSFVVFMRHSEGVLNKTAPLLESSASGAMQNFDAFIVEQDADSVPTPGAATSIVQQFNDSWVSLAEAFSKFDDVLFEGLFPTAFILNKAPEPGVYWLAGDGTHGDQGGTPRGWRQYNDTTEVWDIVWLDGQAAPKPVIPSVHGSRAYIDDTAMGGAYRNSSFYYSAVTDAWSPQVTPRYITPTYSEAELAFAENIGGFVGDSVFENSSYVFHGSWQNNAICYRVPVPGQPNKFVYTFSLYRASNLPAEDNLTRTYIGDADGNVLEEIAGFDSAAGFVDVTTLGTGFSNDEVSLGFQE